MGGGYDINLIPQLGALNVSKRWRDIERYLTTNVGTSFYIRLQYADITDRPDVIEYGYETEDGELVVSSFANI